MRTYKTPHWTMDQVFTLLVIHCGAHEDMRAEFVSYVSDLLSSEFRFQGALGFGGKLYLSRPVGVSLQDFTDEGLSHVRVGCYREDETPERLAMMEEVNKHLESRLMTREPGYQAVRS